MNTVIKVIGTFLNEFYECKNEELPLDFNYKNKVGMYYNILTKSDAGYKKVFPLEVHFISTRNNKLKLFEILSKIENELNSKSIDKYWITSNDPVIIDAQDDEYEHFILNYHVNEY